MGKFKNIPNQSILVLCMDVSGLPVTGDAANISCKVSKNGGTITPLSDTVPTEMQQGYYRFTLTQAETNANELHFIPRYDGGATRIVQLAEPANGSTTFELSAIAILSGEIAGLNDPTAASIADAVWDENITSHTSTNSAGEYVVSNLAKSVYISGNLGGSSDVTDILAKVNYVSGNILSATEVENAVWDADITTHTSSDSAGEYLGVNIPGLLSSISSTQTTIISDIGDNSTDLSTINSKINTVDSIVDNILLKTLYISGEMVLDDNFVDDIWGADLTAYLTPGQAGKALFDVESAVDTEIADIVARTLYISGNLGTGGGGGPDASQIADAVWTEIITTHETTDGSAAQSMENIRRFIINMER